MGKFSKISSSAFSELQTDAGVLLKTFNPEAPEIADENIICATTGGINPTCVPTYTDWGSDIDNCPNNTKELKKIDGWDCGMSFTSLGVTAEVIRLALGAADIDETTSKITPRASLKDTDFGDIWWVGDRSDGGFVAVCLKNALSTGGFSLQTTKNGKGQIAVTLTGHVSINDTDTVPMEFYSSAVTEAASVEEGTEE